ncbi:M12 family metallo-peptidase [Dyadobacter jiangsuensis]
MKNLISKLMFQRYFIFILVCGYLTSSNLFAQTIGKSETHLFTLATDDEISKLSLNLASKYLQLKNSRIYKNVFPVRLGKLPKIQRSGILTFKLPASETSLTFVAKKVDATDEDNFTWYGTSPDYMNTALFTCEKGRLSGSFNAGGRSFQVGGAEGGVGVLMEHADNSSALCGSKGAPLSTESIAPVIMPDKEENARAGVCTEPIRVLILYTQQASDHTWNIVETANSAVAQFNQAIDNVGRSIPQTNKITVASIQPITFTTNNPENTTSSQEAANWLNSNSTVQSLRNTYNADLVVCFIFKSQSHAGWAAQIPANNAQFSAIVRIESTPIWTFAHEIGHLLGGRHHDDSNGPQYSHGYAFTGTDNVLYQDIMYNGTTGTRINYFSAPNINYAGVPVGTYANNDVARRISEVSTTVVNFRPSTTQPFNAAIIGPTSISTAGYYDWELYTFCRDFLTTTWQFSTDGFNYGSPVGFGDMVNFYYIDEGNNGTLYLRCTITTDQNQTYVTTTTINVNICGGCRQVAEKEIAFEQKTLNVNTIFPNPAGANITVDYSLKERSDVNIQLIDVMGKSVVNQKLGSVATGAHKHSVTTLNLPNGIYNCRVNINGQIVNTPLIISK